MKPIDLYEKSNCRCWHCIKKGFDEFITDTARYYCSIMTAMLAEPSVTNPAAADEECTVADMETCWIRKIYKED